MLTVRKAGHRELERYYSLFEIDFNKAELLPKLCLHKGLLNGSWELVVVSDEETRIDVAYALVGCNNLYGYALLKYFAVMPWYREKGRGVQAMRLINARYAEKQGIICEISSLDRDEAKVRKLKRFFSRFGYQEVGCDCNIGGAPTHIMLKPCKCKTDITPVAHRILPDFYDNISAKFMLDIKKPE